MPHLTWNYIPFELFVQAYVKHSNGTVTATVYPGTCTETQTDTNVTSPGEIMILTDASGMT